MPASDCLLEETAAAAAGENGDAPRFGVASLTPRQHEVLQLLARGFYYREIGTALGISHSTVRAHLHMIYHKLNVRSRSRAVLKFQEQSANRH
jgi:DNA-binding CsgD family transcriptional regulator